MPDPTLLAIIAIILLSFFVGLFVVRIVNGRGDDALTGVLKGVRIPFRTRKMILFTHYMPLALFYAAWNVVMGIGLFGLARDAENDVAKALGYMGGFMLECGGVVWFVLGGAWVFHAWTIIREAEASKDHP
ncbi:MAG: hypothetical protein AAF500_04260 [Myxococcota bacterium]